MRLKNGPEQKSRHFVDSAIAGSRFPCVDDVGLDSQEWSTIILLLVCVY